MGQVYLCRTNHLLGSFAQTPRFALATQFGESGNMSNLKDRTILVVGATGAFGTSFVSALSSQGASVVATASAPETAHRLPTQAAGSYFLDLTHENQISEFANQLAQQQPRIDGIILASGLVAFGSIAETPSQIAEQLLQVNFLGQVSLVGKLLPLLVKSAEQFAEPFVLSISGVIAENPMANMAAYSASKTALHGYSIAAAREFRRLGIRWIDARPGHTETGLASRAIFGQAPTFGSGLNADSVVARMIDAIVADEKDLPSSAFTSAVV